MPPSTYICKAAAQRSSSTIPNAPLPHPIYRHVPRFLFAPPHTPGPGYPLISSWRLACPHSCCPSQLSAAALSYVVRVIFSQYTIGHTSPRLKTSSGPWLPLVLASLPASPCAMAHLFFTRWFPRVSPSRWQAGLSAPASLALRPESHGKEPEDPLLLITR